MKQKVGWDTDISVVVRYVEYDRLHKIRFDTAPVQVIWC